MSGTIHHVAFSAIEELRVTAGVLNDLSRSPIPSVLMIREAVGRIDQSASSIEMDANALIAENGRLREALSNLVKEIRAYNSPECDDEGSPGALELKAADIALNPLN